MSGKHVRAGEGKTYRLGRITLNFKVSAADTGGAYTLCEAIEPPEAGAGLHRHATYDETHIVCEGRYEGGSARRRCSLAPATCFSRRAARRTRSSASAPRPGAS